MLEHLRSLLYIFKQSCFSFKDIYKMGEHIKLVIRTVVSKNDGPFYFATFIKCLFEQFVPN